jgi:tetratricopeptide (TPR) repeat protein
VDAHIQLLLVAAVDAVYGNPESAGKLADQAAEIATAHDRPDLLLKALNWKIIAYYHQARLSTPEGFALVRNAVALSRQSSDFDQRFWLECNLGAWYVETGELASAERSFTRAASALERLPHPRHRTNLLINRGQLALEVGDHEAAFDYFSKGVGTGVPVSHEASSCFALAGLGLAQLFRGELSDARRILHLLPPRPTRWTFDPFLWLAFEARMAALSTSRSSVIGAVRSFENGLKETVPTAWIRIRLLRFEIAFRAGDSPTPREVEELATFLDERLLKYRKEDLDNMLERFQQRRGARRGT